MKWYRIDESASNFKIGDKFVDDTHENFGKIYTITSLGVDSYDLEDVNGTQVTRDANYIGTNMHMASKEEIEKTQFAPTMESTEDEDDDYEDLLLAGRLESEAWEYVCSHVPYKVYQDIMDTDESREEYISIVGSVVSHNFKTSKNLNKDVMLAVMDYYSSKQ